MDKFSRITQTEDSANYPLDSNFDSSIQQNMYKDLNLYNANSVQNPPDIKDSENPSNELQLVVKQKNFADLSLKYINEKKGWYIVDNLTKELISKITSDKITNDFIKRRSFHMRKQTFAAINIYEKEIIVWIRLNCYNFKDTFSLASELMQKFNISEAACNYLIETSSI
jgi:hypothetical protein